MKKKERTRNLLLSVAKNLLLKNHYDNLKVTDITSVAKVSKGTFFYHFESKETVMLEIFKDIYLQNSQHIKTIATNREQTVKERFETLITTLLKPSNKELELNTLLNHVPKAYYLLLEHIRCQIYSPIVHHVIQEGIHEGIFTPYDNPEIITTILYSGINNTLYCTQLKTNNHLAYQITIHSIQTLLSTVLGTPIELDIN